MTQQISKKKFRDIKPFQRSYLADFLKTFAIIGVIIDNSLGPDSWSFKLIGANLWAGQGVPIFLIITGYLFSMSYERHNVQRLKDCYKGPAFFKRLLRFTMPYLFAICVFVPMLIWVQHEATWPIVDDIFFGGPGPGAYYVAVIFLITFTFPLIYFFMKKFGFNGLIIMFFITLVWDLIAFATGLLDYGDRWYKRIIIREFFLLSSGAYIYIYRNEKYKWAWAIPSFIIGIAFIVMVYYFNVPMHVNHKWFQVCELSNLYCVPVIALLFKKVKMKNQPWWQITGAATYHIFLTQMVYLHFVNYPIFNEGHYVFTLFNIISCIWIGLVFWAITEPVTKLTYKAVDVIHNKRQLKIKS